MRHSFVARLCGAALPQIRRLLLKIGRLFPKKQKTSCEEHWICYNFPKSMELPELRLLHKIRSFLKTHTIGAPSCTELNQGMPAAAAVRLPRSRMRLSIAPGRLDKLICFMSAKTMTCSSHKPDTSTGNITCMNAFINTQEAALGACNAHIP